MRFFSFSRKKSETQRKGADFGGYRPLSELFGGYSESRAGIPVSARSSLECSTVLACVRLIANGVAQVPFRLILQQGGMRQPATDHALFDLLYMAPNEYQSAFEFWHMVMMHLCLTGNAYIWLNRGLDGKVTELLPYPPGCVTVQHDGWETSYAITLQDKRYVTVPSSDMWHVKWLSWDGVAGLDGVAYARDAIGLSLALDRHGATSFKNGSRLSGILMVDRTLNEQQRRDLRAAWESAFSGSESAGKVAVLGADMKWQQLSSANDAAQFDESRRYQVEEICRAFGVDPVMIGYSDKAATYASVEQKSIQHVVYTLGPWYACLEKSATRWLLTEKERRQGFYFKFNVNALLRGASADRASFYTSLYNIGALSPNEIRDLEDMNPYEGGDEYRVPLNMETPGKKPDDAQKNAEDTVPRQNDALKTEGKGENDG